MNMLIEKPPKRQIGFCLINRARPGGGGQGRNAARPAPDDVGLRHHVALTIWHGLPIAIAITTTRNGNGTETTAQTRRSVPA